MNKFPWYIPEPTTTVSAGLRSQIDEIQSSEIARLRLINEFLRSQISAADAGTPGYLVKAAVA